MRIPRKHWSPPYDDHTLCGRSVYYGAENLHLAIRQRDITCLLSRHNLAEPWHGTLGGYRNHGCRCAPCTKANTAWQAGWRARHNNTEPPRHNAASYVNYGCRCDVCRAAHSAALRGLREGVRT